MYLKACLVGYYSVLPHTLYVASSEDRGNQNLCQTELLASCKHEELVGR